MSTALTIKIPPRPSANIPFVDGKGNITPAWLQYIVALEAALKAATV
jgi:hypothetical protein